MCAAREPEPRAAWPGRGTPLAGWWAKSTAMPAFWLAVAAVTMPTSSGPANEVIFPDSANSPKNCVMRSAGASRANSERVAACTGPATAPIKSPTAR